VQLVSKIFNLCGNDPPTSQAGGQTDGQTTCNRKTVLCTIVRRAVKNVTKRFTTTVGSENACNVTVRLFRCLLKTDDSVLPFVPLYVNGLSDRRPKYRAIPQRQLGPIL